MSPGTLGEPRIAFLRLVAIAYSPSRFIVL
jgi:hypothetical protein